MHTETFSSIAVHATELAPGPEVDGRGLAAATDGNASTRRVSRYESAYFAREGKKPRKRSEWGDMWPEYERYVVLRKMAAEAAIRANM